MLNSGQSSGYVARHLLACSRRTYKHGNTKRWIRMLPWSWSGKFLSEPGDHWRYDCFPKAEIRSNRGKLLNKMVIMCVRCILDLFEQPSTRQDNFADGHADTHASVATDCEHLVCLFAHRVVSSLSECVWYTTWF